MAMLDFSDPAISTSQGAAACCDDGPQLEFTGVLWRARSSVHAVESAARRARKGTTGATSATSPTACKGRGRCVEADHHDGQGRGVRLARPCSRPVGPGPTEKAANPTAFSPRNNGDYAGSRCVCRRRGIAAIHCHAGPRAAKDGAAIELCHGDASSPPLSPFPSPPAPPLAPPPALPPSPPPAPLLLHKHVYRAPALSVWQLCTHYLRPTRRWSPPAPLAF